MPVQDVFDREVKGSIEDLKKALLGDMGKEKNAQKDDNTEQLKRLNDNLEKIVGTDLDRELKALNKLTKKVADNYKDVADKKGNIEKQATAFGNAVAKSMNPKVGRSIEDAIEKAVGDLNPAFDNLADKTMTFGKALERGQRRFSDAFGSIGKDFAKSFPNMAEKLKGWFKGAAENEEKSKGIWENMREGWNNFVADFKKDLLDAANSAWMSVTGWFKSGVDKITGWFKIGVDKVSGWFKTGFDKVTSWIPKKIGDWFGKKGTQVAKGAGFVARSVGTLGKAAAGTVKDFLRIGKSKKAGRETDDLTGGGKPTEMQDEGEAIADTLVNEMGKNELQLCQCICKCIQELMGVSEKGTKATEKTGEATKKSGGFMEKLFKGEKKAAGDEKTKKGLLGTIGQGIKGLLGRGKGGESQEKLMRDFIRQQRQEKFGRAGEAMRGKALYATSAAQKFVFSEKPMESLLAGAAQGISKVAGKVVEAPFWAVGELLEKSMIPGLTALGPAVKMVGAALGGLAEGLINFVLTPLIGQVEFMNKASQDMFVSTGATRATPTVNMGGLGKPPPGTGEEWGVLAKRVTEFHNNMDSSARTLEKLGAYMHDVAETGHSLATVQSTISKNFRRGIQDTKTLNKVTKTGLQTAYLLNASAEGTADLFADWHQHLGMSTVDLRGMQRGLTQIARSTGLIGDELIHVAKSARVFMENMRAAGNLTTTAAKALIEITARGKKTGTEGVMNVVADLFSKGILRGGGGEAGKNLMAVLSGQGASKDLKQAMLYGGELTSERLGEIGKLMDKFVRQQVEAGLPRTAKAQPGETTGALMKRLDPRERSRITAMIQSIGLGEGVGLETLRVAAGELTEAGKTFAERIEDLNKAARTAKPFEELQKIADQEKAVAKDGLTWRQKFDKAMQDANNDTGKALDQLINMADLPDKMRKQFQGQISAQQANYQRQQLFITTGANLIDAFNNEIEDGKKTWDQAIKGLTAGNKDFLEYLKDIGANVNDGGEAIEKALMDQAKRIKEEAVRAGAPEIVAAVPTAEEITKTVKGKDVKALKDLADNFARLGGILQVQAKQNADPIEKIKRKSVV